LTRDLGYDTIPIIGMGIVGYIFIRKQLERKKMGVKKDSNEYLTKEAIIRDITNAITGLDYGTVTIKVHNAKIMQIEITQKKRFDNKGLFEKGGGI
jgi:hypothetical protein